MRKRYRDENVMTPYEKLKSLDNAEQHLCPGVTFGQLDAVAFKISDFEAARARRGAYHRRGTGDPELSRRRPVHPHGRLSEGAGR